MRPAEPPVHGRMVDEKTLGFVDRIKADNIPRIQLEFKLKRIQLTMTWVVVTISTIFNLGST